jgi:hypothetical protein
MRSLSVIGTAHIQDPHLFRALEEALEAINPGQLILEMPDETARSGEVAAQKPEMQVAYRWAVGRGVPVRGHEPPGFSILRDGLPVERIGALIQDMDELISDLTTRRSIDIFCGRVVPESAEERRLSAIIDELIDPKKAIERTDAIIAAVRRLAAPDGAVVIICGGNHVQRLAATLPECRIVHGEHFF